MGMLILRQKYFEFRIPLLKTRQTVLSYRGVSGYLKLGGQVVMWPAPAAKLLPGGAFYPAKNWVGNCPPCPPATYGPKNVSFLRLFLGLTFLFKTHIKTHISPLLN